MTHDAPLWSVVATVDEPLVLVQAFVAWHLALGAAEVTLYFDRPDDPAAQIMEQVPQVRVIRCDMTHWQERRPAKHEVRQVQNATQAYRACTADWLLHCDADEYLWAPGGVSAALAAMAPAMDCAIVPVAERVYLPGTQPMAIFDGVFRRPFTSPARVGARVFGPDYALTRGGLAGHMQGKVFTRTGRGLELSIHRPKAKYACRMAPVTGVELLHFDGLTPQHWLRKLRLRAEMFAHHGGMAPSPHRQAQIDAILADPQGGMAVHDRVKRLTPDLARILTRKGLLLHAPFDLAPMVADLFGAVDLSCASIDAQQKGAATGDPLNRLGG
ncbi:MULTISPECIES: glycosyltransferase family 2 protein [unclassified Yoonia]|uniref:glycosyltransferase family 2 protein n=1 Tax=unclassified Yoonia TaxID=2629118 RepID=UPI002AFF56ED|nr:MULTISPECIES: glycosyltransferase family 2 protein [unclassified Yoonia]